MCFCDKALSKSAWDERAYFMFRMKPLLLTWLYLESMEIFEAGHTHEGLLLSLNWVIWGVKLQAQYGSHLLLVVQDTKGHKKFCFLACLSLLSQTSSFILFWRDSIISVRTYISGNPRCTLKTIDSLGVLWESGTRLGLLSHLVLGTNNYMVLDLSGDSYWWTNKSPLVLFLYRTLTNTVLHFKVHSRGKPR